MCSLLGAEVIAVEPPGDLLGRLDHLQMTSCRRMLRYGIGRTTEEKSVVLDLDTADDRKLLALIDGADIVIEAYGPGVLDTLGLSYEAMSERNPALIHLSISAFGDEGPKALWEATDLTIMASGGQMSLAGDLDRAPVRIPLDQAYLHVSSEAVEAALLLSMSANTIQDRSASTSLLRLLPCRQVKPTWWRPRSTLPQLFVPLEGSPFRHLCPVDVALR